MADLAKFADIGGTPISDAAPAGEDASYDEEYEELVREIEKLSMVQSPDNPIDWDKVAALGAVIISTRSKDLKIAAYMGIALLHTDGLPGLAVGVKILSDMAGAFWDILYPPKRRLRGRLNAVFWWHERVRTWFADYTDETPIPADLADDLKRGLRALDEALSDKSDDVPALRPLLETVGRLPVQARPEDLDADRGPKAETPPPPADPGETSQAEAPPAARTPQESSPPATPSRPSPSSAPSSSADEAGRLLKSGLDRLFSASYGYLKDDPANPLSYRLVRLAAWLPISGPPAAEGKNTMLAAPVENITALAEQLLASGKYREALAAAESRVMEFRFWLDLSRISAGALRRLGGEYAPARKALETETALFAARLSGVEELCFSDGTPFADAKTKSWLRQINPVREHAEAGLDAETLEIEKITATAGEMAAADETLKAVGMLQDRLDASKSGRLRLLWRASLVEILLGAGRPEPARPLIDDILADIDEYKLDRFDPQLALRGLGTALSGLAALGDEDDNVLARTVLSRITRLSPSEGFRLAGRH